MNPNDLAGLGCSGLPSMARCAADLPDNPQCAPNYHFGMLLGVDDFRAEQGFHLGRLRRHQRLLHGAGVVAGYPVSFDAGDFELRVGAGLAVDALGRDLLLETAQCVSLPLWWQAHRGDEAFADIATPDDATLDLELRVCHSSCLGSPVPAIAEPCAGDAADIAYSRVCETVRLTLARPSPAAAAVAPSMPLLQMWLGRSGPRLDADGQPIAADQWLLDRRQALQALAHEAQPAARALLAAEVLARAVAEAAPAPPQPDTALGGDDDALCLLLARLRQVHLTRTADGWTASVGAIELGDRQSLLPTALLQQLLLADPPAAPAPAGPVVVGGGATLDGSTLSLVFSQPLAAASVAGAAFAVSEFAAASGWQPFAPAAPSYDDSDAARPTVRLLLDREPTGGLLRATVVGSGSTPLLGANLIAAGAPHAASDGRTLSTTISRG